MDNKVPLNRLLPKLSDLKNHREKHLKRKDVNNETD